MLPHSAQSDVFFFAIFFWEGGFSPSTLLRERGIFFPQILCCLIWGNTALANSQRLPKTKNNAPKIHKNSQKPRCYFLRFFVKWFPIVLFFVIFCEMVRDCGPGQDVKLPGRASPDHDGCLHQEFETATHALRCSSACWTPMSFRPQSRQRYGSNLTGEVKRARVLA